MRKCTRCGEIKDESLFFIRDKATNRLHAQCKDCYKRQRQIYYKLHYQDHKDEYLKRAKLRRRRLLESYRAGILKFLSENTCVGCGESDIRVLELDHLDPSKKRFSISQAARLGYNWSDILEELKNCQVLCANCHRRRTSQQYKWWKNEL